MIATEEHDDVYLIEHEPKSPRSFGSFAAVPNQMLILTFDGRHGKQERERERGGGGKGTTYAR